MKLSVQVEAVVVTVEMGEANHHTVMIYQRMVEERKGIQALVPATEPPLEGEGAYYKNYLSISLVTEIDLIVSWYSY